MAKIRTERLLLRPWRLDEAPRLLEIRGLPEVARWMSVPEPWTSVDKATTSISEWQAKSDSPGPAGVWAIVPKEGGEPIGSVSLNHLPNSEEYEIGWLLHPANKGHGYAGEAAVAVRDYAARSGLTHIWAIMWPDNDSSAAVAMRLGMEDLGVIDDPWYGSAKEPTSRIFRIDLTG